MGQLVFQATLGGAVNLIGPNIASTVNFTLPSADGSSGQTWTTNGSGVLSFGTLGVAGGGTGTTTSTGTGSVVLSNSPTLVTPALGTPSSGVVTNLTGTASININGTVGATTPTTGAFTTTTVSTSETLSYGTANGVTYLNGSKVLTSGSALTFNGSNLYLGSDGISTGATTVIALGASSYFKAGSTFGFLVNNSADTLNFFKIDTSGNAIFYPSGSEGMRLNTTGLGIGTSSPAGKLDIYQNSSRYVRAYPSSGLADFEVVTNNNVQPVFAVKGTGTADLIRAYAGATQAMTIDSSGSTRLNTTSTVFGGGEYLSVATGSGNTGVGFKGSNVGQVLGVWNSTVGSSTYINFATGSGGSTTGSISTNGTTTAYNITSDYRLKNVIGAVSGAGERIDALEPIEYTWKADGTHTRGFLAHKFQEVYANSVTGTKDAVDEEGKPVYQQMQASTAEVIADLVAEIQSLRQRVAQLETN